MPFAFNSNGTECIPVVKVEDCKQGFHRDETGACVPDTVECGPGYHLENGVCVKDTLECPEGYELNDAGTECIPVIEIKDKKCDPGYVYDEALQKCVPIEEDECPVGYHRDESGVCVQDECPEGYVRNLVTGACEKPLVCEEGFELNDEGTACIPVIKVTACPTGQHRDETGKCVPDTEECAEGFHLENGLCVPDDEGCEDGYEKINGACVPVCAEGYVRNLATGVCEKVEDKGCPPGQAKNAEGKCVPIIVTPKPPVECPTGFRLVNGACVPITTTTIPTYTSSGYYGPGEKNEPIYAGGMDDFNLLATLEELLKESSTKKDTKETKQKTKMATGGHLDDLLAEQMTVDDLLKLLR